MKKRYVASILAIAMAASIGLAACGRNTVTGASSNSSAATTVSTESTAESGEAGSAEAESVSDETTATGLNVTVADLDLSSMFTERDLDGSYDASSAAKITFSDGGAEAFGEGVTVDGSTVTITAEGTYVVSGETSDGQILVAAEDTAKVQIVLDGVSISNADGPAILVTSADKVFITLADGSENTLSDTGAAYTQLDTYDSNIDGVIFSDCDLTLNGSGTLNINAQTAHGIACKDDLKITDGTINVTAVGKGIQANDSIRIAGGEITVNAEDDAVHTSKEDEEGKGYIYIQDGTLNLSSGDDGIHAGTALVIAGGTVNVLESYEGLEGDTIDILDGDVNVTASDDGFNASSSSNQDTNNEALEGEQQMPQEGEAPQAPADGEIPEGFQEGEQPTPPGDGEMPEGFSEGERPERPEGGFGGGFGGFGGGGGAFDVDENAYIHISGGTIVVNADGDGIDSNGELVISGGVVTVYGPTNNGNGALDVGSTATVTGGTVLVAGSSGMAVGFDENSTQYSIKYNFSSTVSGGTTVTLTDESGNVILSFIPEKNFQNVVLSSSDLTEGPYTIAAGDLTEEITVDSISTSAGTETGGFGGFGGGFGGFGGRGGRGGQNSQETAETEPAAQ